MRGCLEADSAGDVTWQHLEPEHGEEALEVRIDLG